MKRITYKDVKRLGLKIQERAENIIIYSDLNNIDEDDDLLDVLCDQEYEIDEFKQYWDAVDISYYVENKNGDCVFRTTTPEKIVEYVKSEIEKLDNNYELKDKVITYKDFERLGLQLQKRTDNITKLSSIIVSDIFGGNKNDNLLDILNNKEYETCGTEFYWDDNDMSYYLKDKNGDCILSSATPEEIVEYVKSEIQKLDNNLEKNKNEKV